MWQALFTLALSGSQGVVGNHINPFNPQKDRTEQYPTLEHSGIFRLFFRNMFVEVSVGTLCLVVEDSLFDDDLAINMVVFHSYVGLPEWKQP